MLLSIQSPSFKACWIVFAKVEDHLMVVVRCSLVGLKPQSMKKKKLTSWCVLQPEKLCCQAVLLLLLLSLPPTLVLLKMYTFFAWTPCMKCTNELLFQFFSNWQPTLFILLPQINSILQFTFLNKEYTVR